MPPRPSGAADVATLLLNAIGAAVPQESVKTATSGLSAGILSRAVYAGGSTEARMSNSSAG